MKLILNPKHRSEAGNVLATTLIITFVIGITLASFLLLTRHQTFANARSQCWNESMALAEAGIEDAMQMINYYNYDSEKLLDWPTVAKDNGWETDDYVVYYTTRWLGSGTDLAYTAWITNSNPARPIVAAIGHRMYHFQYKSVPVSSAVVGAAFGGYDAVNINRGVVCHTIKDALWAMAMLADKEIDLNGNGITTDSFNSADTTAVGYKGSLGYATYDVADRRDKGDVATNSRIIDSLNAGNADIMGLVSTGPGGSVAIGPNGSVGDEAWVSSGTSGIQPGAVTDDMNVQIDPPSLPDGWYPDATMTYWKKATDLTNADGTITAYNHAMFLSGNYKATTLEGSLYVGPGVEATLYLTDSVKLTGNEQIYIHPDAKRLTIYMGGTQFYLGGGGVINETGKADKFLYYGLASNTDLVFGGNGDFTGAIYAPTADFTLGGGGSTAYDFIGASVTSTVTMNGSYNFHYDEDLANFGPTKGFVPVTWAEK